MLDITIACYMANLDQRICLFGGYHSVSLTLEGSFGAKGRVEKAGTNMAPSDRPAAEPADSMSLYLVVS